MAWRRADIIITLLHLHRLYLATTLFGQGALNECDLYQLQKKMAFCEICYLQYQDSLPHEIAVLHLATCELKESYHDDTTS